MLQLLDRVTPLVRPIEHELGRYQVTSETDGETVYTVDLDAYWGNGWCDCPNFRIYRETDLAKLNAAERRQHGPNACKHIRLARIVFGQELLATFIRQRAEHERTLKRKQ